MNAIILTALWGLILMFCGVTVKNKSLIKYIAGFGLATVLVAAVIEMLTKKSFFQFEYNQMLVFDAFNLSFICISLVCTLLYFLLTGSEIEKVGPHVAEYFALIFFILFRMRSLIAFKNFIPFRPVWDRRAPCGSVRCSIWEPWGCWPLCPCWFHFTGPTGWDLR